MSDLNLINRQDPILEAKKRRQRSIAIALLLGLWVFIFFVTTIVRLHLNISS